MSLVPDYGNSSASSSSESESEEETEVISAIEESKTKLPPPSFIGDDPSTALSNSVFKNPFMEAENAKEALLQKHVKMVDAKDKLIVINGKRICWNYRKGRCRFGHNCKYAHDSDLQKTKEQLDAEKQTQHTVVCQNQDIPQPTLEEINKIKDEAVLNQRNRKKRPGLSEGLVPGKKVMKQYISQKK